LRRLIAISIAASFFLRSLDAYLSPWQLSDVIEMPLAGELDIAGWELGKALKLLLKGNAVVIEWLTSPLTYSADEQFRLDFLDLARNVADRILIMRHYLHLGERQRRTYFADEKAIPLKKIFYALRPAAALRWLRLHPEQAVVPMNFPLLIAEADVPAELYEMIEALLEKKAETRELGIGPLPRPVADFISAEFDQARADIVPASQPLSPDFKAMAEDFFRTAVHRFDANLLGRG